MLLQVNNFNQDNKIDQGLCKNKELGIRRASKTTVQLQNTSNLQVNRKVQTFGQQEIKMIHIKENREGEGRGKIKLEIHIDKIFQMKCNI